MIMVNPSDILGNAGNDLLSSANSLEGTTRTQNAGQEAQPQRPQIRKVMLLISPRSKQPMATAMNVFRLPQSPDQ